MGEQGVDQRVLLMARAGMHDQPGRLVQDEQVVVLKQNLERHLLRLGFDFFEGRLRQFHGIARAHEIARPRRLSVQPNESPANQRLQTRPGKIDEFESEKTVQPQTGAFARHVERDHDRALTRQSGLSEVLEEHETTSTAGPVDWQNRSPGPFTPRK